MHPLHSQRLVSLLFLIVFGVMSRTALAQNPAGDGLTAPGSWADFASYLADGGDLGWWEASGVTTNVWKTLPAGINYRYRARTSLDDSGRLVVRTFTYVDDQGNLLSSGSETVVWDARSKTVIWSVSGFDGDQPWSDSGRLVGYDDSKMVVSSREEAAGDSYELRTTIERTGENTRRRTVSRADGKDTPFVQEFTRVNHLVEAFSGWDPTGTWATDMGGVRFINRTSWSADRRCLLITEGTLDMSALPPDDSDDEPFIDVSGNGIIWFDLTTRKIRQKYVTSTGLVLDGEVESVSSERLEMRFTGTDAEGVALDARITSVRKGDQLVSTFSDMTYDGRARTPAWAREPMTARRE